MSSRAANEFALWLAQPSTYSPGMMGILPPELRTSVWKELVTRSKHTSLGDIRSIIRKSPLLQVFWPFRAEIIRLIFSRLGYVHIYLLNAAEVSDFVRLVYQVVPICGTRIFEDLVIMANVPARQSLWTQLDNLLPLLEVMRATGFEPETKRYRPNTDRGLQNQRMISDSSIFRLHVFFVFSRYSGALEFIMEKALCLARRARAEGWAEEKLARVYAQYVAKRKKDRGKSMRFMVEGQLL